MLAEDFSGLYMIFVMILVTPFVGLGIAHAKHWPRWALVFGWLGVIIGALLLLGLAMTDFREKPIFWITLSPPLVAGIICLARWRQYKK